MSLYHFPVGASSNRPWMADMARHSPHGGEDCQYACFFLSPPWVFQDGHCNSLQIWCKYLCFNTITTSVVKNILLAVPVRQNNNTTNISNTSQSAQASPVCMLMSSIHWIFLWSTSINGTGLRNQNTWYSLNCVNDNFLKLCLCWWECQGI